MKKFWWAFRAFWWMHPMNIVDRWYVANFLYEEMNERGIISSPKNYVENSHYYKRRIK